MPDGSAAASESAHQTRFAPNLNAAGAIELVSATKQLFRTHLLGLFYYDAATGKTATLAKLQDALGELVAPNQIVYRGALAGLVRADVRFTITRGGWESDVIILECPPEPELFGLEPKTTRLEVWTEFLDPPVPARQVRVLKAETDPALRAAMVEPDLVDETLDFGDLWLPQGKAFVCGPESSANPGEAARIEVARVGPDPGAVPVAKRWLEIEGRQVLVESVDWLDLWPRLSQLPVSKDYAATGLKDRVRTGRWVDVVMVERRSGGEIRLAQAPYRETGVVIDYIAVNPSGSYTFESGVTYYVSSGGYLGGTTRFMPGCVLKFAPGADLIMCGPIECSGGSPSGVLTAKDDDLYGEKIAGSTGNPTYTAPVALWVYYPSEARTLSGLRVRWAQTAIQFSGSGAGGPTHWVSSVRLEQCQRGVVANGASVVVSGVTACGVAIPTYADPEQGASISGSASIDCDGDTDSDGLGDTWELAQFGNLTSQTGTMDADGDGLSNLEEQQRGLNPKSTDTDYDGRSDSQELAENTHPLDHTSYTPVRLGYWRFNTPDWRGEGGQMPTVTQSVGAVASWSGTAASIDNGTAAPLKYRVVEAGGAANLNLRRGTVRLWFRPSFASGVGGGSWGRLLEVGAYSGDASYGQWCWWLDPTQQQMGLMVQGGGQGAMYLSTGGPLNWPAGEWRQVVLTYSPEATRLYVDGTCVAAGAGVWLWPSEAVQGQDGFSVGGDGWGGQQARGQFEELETFNYVLSEEEIAANHAAMREPESFSVRFSARHVSQGQVTGTIEGGPAGALAVLVNSTDFASAVWTPFTSTLNINLGSGDGTREVWVGLKGLSGKDYWQRQRLYLDTTPPVLTVTEPSTATTSRPLIQIKGHCLEALSSLRYDVSHTGGTVTNLQGFTVDQSFNPTTGELITNWFQCADVELAEGQNTITLRATDRAGNTSTTTRNVILDLAGDNTPPQITVHWPSEAMSLAGSTFLLRGQLDDATASLRVSGLTSTPVEGIVERNGLFWVEDLPLVPGNNTLTLTATDAAGNEASHGLSVVGTGLEIAIEEIPEEDYADSQLMVVGTIGSGAYAVWVNGRRASVPAWNGTTYEWIAEAVPLLDLGTALLEVRAIPLSENGGNGDQNPGRPTLQDMGNPTGEQTRDFSVQSERPPWVTVESFGTSRQWEMPGPFVQNLDLRWREGQAATRVERIVVPPGLEAQHGYTRTETTTWPADHWTPAPTGSRVRVFDSGRPSEFAEGIPAPRFHWEECLVADSRPVNGTSERDSYQRDAWGVVKLHTGGKGKSRRSLFSFTALVNQVPNRRWDPESGLPHGGPAIPPTRGILIGDVGFLGSDGYLFTALPEDDTVVITPFTGAADFYVYSVAPTKHRLTITANNVPLLPDSLVPSAKFCVGQRIELASVFVPPVPTFSQAQVTSKWLLEGEFRNQSSPSAGSVNYRVNPVRLVEPITSAWWINGEFDYQRLRQQLGLVVAFANGQVVPVISQGVMGMHRPRFIGI